MIQMPENSSYENIMVMQCIRVRPPSGHRIMTGCISASRRSDREYDCALQST